MGVSGSAVGFIYIKIKNKKTWDYFIHSIRFVFFSGIFWSPHTTNLTLKKIKNAAYTERCKMKRKKKRDNYPQYRKDTISRQQQQQQQQQKETLLLFVC